MQKKCNKVVKPLLTGRTKSHIIPVHPSKNRSKVGNKPYFGSDEKQLVDTWDQTDPRKEKRSMYAYIAFIPSVGRSLCKGACS